MTTTTTIRLRPGVRRSTKPRVRYGPKLAFISTCPKCGHERRQHGYSRPALLNLLKARCHVEAYCFVCKACWPISERERKEVITNINGALP